jgi:hypothetical protein
MFITVHSELVSIEQPKAVTEYEIEWVKVSGFPGLMPFSQDSVPMIISGFA